MFSWHFELKLTHDQVLSVWDMATLLAKIVRWDPEPGNLWLVNKQGSATTLMSSAEGVGPSL